MLERDLPDMPELMIAGPGEVHEDTRQAMGHQLIAHYGDVWTQLHNETCDAVGKIIGAKHRPYLIPGSGTAAVEVAVVNMFDPGQKVVIPASGYFGTRLKEVAEAAQLEVIDVPVEVGKAVQVDAIEKAAKGADGVALVHVETSTGVRHPIAEAAAAAHRAGALIVVDAVASAGGEVLDVDGMQLDALATGTQKGLEGPSGLGVVALGAGGLRRLQDRKAGPRSWYFNLGTWDRYRDEWGAWHPHPVTMPTSLFMGVAQSTSRILEAGVENYISRRAELAKKLRGKLADLGLPPVAAPGVEANLVVAAWAEDCAAIQKHLISRGIMISLGLGPTHNKAIRIGLMGRTASEEMVERVTGLIAEALGR